MFVRNSTTCNCIYPEGCLIVCCDNHLCDAKIGECHSDEWGVWSGLTLCPSCMRNTMDSLTHRITDGAPDGVIVSTVRLEEEEGVEANLTLQVKSGISKDQLVRAIEHIDDALYYYGLTMVIEKVETTYKGSQG